VIIVSKLSGCRTRVLQPESFETMITPQVPILAAPKLHYALMLRVGEYRGRPRFGHGGAISTFHSQFELMPDSGSAVILQCNRAGEEFDTAALVNSIFDELLGLSALEQANPDHPADPKVWSRYEGRYLSPMTGLSEVTVSGDMLVLSYQGKETPLRCIDEHLYEGEMGPQKVVIGFQVPDGDAEGPVEWAAVMGMPARRTEGGVVEVDPSTLPPLAGTYVGDMGGQALEVEVTVEGSQLMARVLVPPQPEAAGLTPMGGRSFASPSGVLEFADGDPAPSLTIAGQLVLHRK